MSRKRKKISKKTSVDTNNFNGYLMSIREGEKKTINKSGPQPKFSITFIVCLVLVQTIRVSDHMK